jgi:hypothetical protein
VTRGEIVEDQDFEAVPPQNTSSVRSYVTCATHYEDRHFFLSPLAGGTVRLG